MSADNITTIPAPLRRGDAEQSVTVGELRAFLACLPDDAPVLIYRRDSPDDDEDESCSGWAVKSVKIAQSIPVAVGCNWDISIFDSVLPISLPVLVLADVEHPIPELRVLSFGGDGVSSFSSHCEPTSSTVSALPAPPKEGLKG